MKQMLALGVCAALLLPVLVSAGQSPASADAPVFVAYYWRAKPGKIDEDARRAGVFEEVRTVTPAPGTVADWTHLRIFRLKNAAAEQALGPGLDAATLRVVPDEATRKANSERSAGLRDLVRREVWTQLR